MPTCPMCGTEYIFDEANAYYLTEEKTICSDCADTIEVLMVSDDSAKIHRALQYIQECLSKTKDADVKNHLTDILENNSFLNEEIELKKFSEYKENFSSSNPAASEHTHPLFQDQYTYSTASGIDLPYVVIQVTLKEKFLGTGSSNLTDLEEVLNFYAYKGYRLHTMTTSNGGSKGAFGGDRIQATLVFEKKEK